MPSSRGLAFLEFREQKKRSPSRAGHLTDRSPLPPSKSNRVRLSVCKHASLLFFRCRACVWGKKGCGSSSVNLCPGMEKGPARGPRSCCEIRPVRGPTTPARKAASPARGGRGNGARKAVRPDLTLIAVLRGRVEKGKQTGQTPGLPPERLLNCVSTTSLRAPRLMEPARGVAPITAPLPPAAGQWRRAFLGRGRRGCSPLAAVCGLGLVRAPALAALGRTSAAAVFVSGLGFALCVRLSAVLRSASLGREP